MFMLISGILQAQSYTINFSGIGATPQAIIVQNVTKGISANLQGTDILQLNLVTSINELNYQENNKLVLYPNPMVDISHFEFYNKENGRVNIQIVAMDGKVLYSYSRELVQGLHKFTLDGVSAGSYLVYICTPKEIITGRLLSMSNQKQNITLLHTEVDGLSSDVFDIDNRIREDNNRKNKKSVAIVNMDYSIGDELKFIASASGFSNSTVYASPSSNETISFTFTSRFYRITPFVLKTNKPSFVNVLVSVTDQNKNGVDNLDNRDFIVKENNVVVGTTESFRYVRSLSTIPYRLKTVLMIDNSASIANKLPELKQAALTLVNGMVKNQEIAVYVFSEGPELICNFTDDVETLTNAINGISLGYASTNLYGSYIAGVNAWSDIYTEKQVQKGFLVFFTDGDDTQGSSTLQQAVSARGSKSTYIVGLGSDLTPSVLNQLANPSPYYSANSISDLPTIFSQIQKSIFDFANSFYMLTYMSPKRSGSQTLRLEIANNTNNASDSYYQASFSASGFEAALSGVYLNPYINADRYGLTEINYPKNEFQLTAVTYWANTVPRYTWSIANEDIATISPIRGSFNEVLLNTKVKGTTTITVNDIANSYTKSVTVNVAILPVVKGSPVADIDYITATSGGEVTDDGGAPIIARGVVWSISPNPTIALSTKTSNGTGIGNFTSSLTGLQNNTTYYVRSYATNSIGTQYGEEVSFTTLQYTTPTVSTVEVSDIKQLAATSGGDVLDTGGLSVTARGVVWSTSPNPTITLSSKTANGSGLGSFTSSIIGLTLNTTYYLRAYATNSRGTSYGVEISFKTKNYDSFTDTRDGTAYKTVEIGNQIWMAENLKYLPSVVGSRTGSETTAYYYVYGYDGTTVADAKATTNYTTYGVLYNWTAACNSCPAGWHLPIDAEWTQLTDFIGNNIGTKLKATSGWTSDNGTDDYGFNALPGGWRYFDGSLRSIGGNGFWWSSTEGPPWEGKLNKAWARNMYYDSSHVGSGDYYKQSGLSVRCVRD